MPPGLLAEIRELGERGVAGAEISRTFTARGESDAPSLRTIQDILREQRASDESEAWSVATAGLTEIPAALEVLRAVVEETEGRRTSLTRSEVDWIVRVRAAAPDLPPWDVYRLARLYLRLGVRGESTAPLDAYLAFGGWRAENQNVYHAAIAAEWVPEPPPEIVYPMTRSEIDALAERWADEWMQKDDRWVRDIRSEGLSEEDVRGVLVRSIRAALLHDRDPDDLADLPFQSIPHEASLRETLATMYRELVMVFVDLGDVARRPSPDNSAELSAAREVVVQEMRAMGVSPTDAVTAANDLEVRAREAAQEQALAAIRSALPAPIRPWLDEARRAEKRRKGIADGK